MPQSQLRDLLAQYQWFWASYKLKIKVNGGNSALASTMAKKAHTFQNGWLKKGKTNKRGKGKFISLKFSFKQLLANMGEI